MSESERRPGGTAGAAPKVDNHTVGGTSFVPTDVFTVELIVAMFPRGVDLTIDNFRPTFEIAQINPKSYGPLLAAVCRRGELVTTGRYGKTRKPSLNGGLRAIYQRPLPAHAGVTP